MTRISPRVTDLSNIFRRVGIVGDLKGQVAPLQTKQVVGGVEGIGSVGVVEAVLRVAVDVTVVDDQVGCPTWSRSIAEATSKMLNGVLPPERGCFHLSEEIFTGIYNYSSSGSINWHGFAREIIQSDPLRHEHVIQKITPISSEEFGAAAKRPKVSILSNGKVEAEFGVISEAWRDQLVACSGEYSQAS